MHKSTPYILGVRTDLVNILARIVEHHFDSLPAYGGYRVSSDNFASFITSQYGDYVCGITSHPRYSYSIPNRYLIVNADVQSITFKSKEHYTAFLLLL